MKLEKEIIDRRIDIMKADGVLPSAFLQRLQFFQIYNAFHSPAFIKQ